MPYANTNSNTSYATLEREYKALNTILILDDDTAISSLLQEILESFGYKVLTAEDGQNAIQICNNDEMHVDVVLTDICLPKSSGCDIATRIGQSHPEIKFIYMSGYPSDELPRDVLHATRPYLQKPFSMASVRSTISAVLNGE